MLWVTWLAAYFEARGLYAGIFEGKNAAGILLRRQGIISGYPEKAFILLQM
jgi:hypothetical protein